MKLNTVLVRADFADEVWLHKQVPSDVSNFGCKSNLVQELKPMVCTLTCNCLENDRAVAVSYKDTEGELIKFQVSYAHRSIGEVSLLKHRVTGLIRRSAKLSINPGSVSFPRVASRRVATKTR